MFRVTYKGIAYVFRMIEEAAQMSNRNNAQFEYGNKRNLEKRGCLYESEN